MSSKKKRCRIAVAVGARQPSGTAVTTTSGPRRGTQRRQPDRAALVPFLEPIAVLNFVLFLFLAKRAKDYVARKIQQAIRSGAKLIDPEARRFAR